MASAEREPLMAKTRPLEPQSWGAFKGIQKRIRGGGQAGPSWAPVIRALVTVLLRLFSIRDSLMFFSILVLVPLFADGIVIKCFSFRRFSAVYAYDGLFTAVYE